MLTYLRGDRAHTDGSTKASAQVARDAARDALRVWGDADVSDLDGPMQLQFITQLRRRGLRDSTIRCRLDRIWAAIRWYKAWHEKNLVVPSKILAKDWPGEADLEALKRPPYTLDELARLLNTAGGAVAGRQEPWWRFMVLALATASRPTALLELTWEQIDLEACRLHLRPKWRRKTKKRRPTVPICPTLHAEVSSWAREGRFVVGGGKMSFTSRGFFAPLAQAARVRGSAGITRHTVRTWLARRGVPNIYADAFMGHKDDGSATGDQYKWMEPEYLAPVARSLEDLFDALMPLLEVPLGGRPPGVAHSNS